MPGRRAPGAEHPTSEQAARRAALLLLARREFGSPELRNKLLSQGYAPDAVEAALASLLTERLLDDGRFLEQFVRVHAGRGQGPARIKQELSACGFSGEVVEAALAAGPDFSTLCRAVRVRKFGASPPKTWAEKGKQARFLQYRGFSSDHIRLALGSDPEDLEATADSLAE
ncbi:MAG: regulatory protein RecX [Steroidobacteraceae bacterium]